MREELPNAKIIWNPNIGQNNPFPYYPGDDVFNLIGPDMYCNPKHYGSPAGCWNDFLSGGGVVNLDAFARFAQAHQKALAIPEWTDLVGDGAFIKLAQALIDQQTSSCSLTGTAATPWRRPRTCPR